MMFFDYRFVMAFVALLYFILQPVINADEIISTFLIFSLTCAISIGANIWLCFRLPIKNPDWKKVVLDYYGIKRECVADSFLTSCMVAAIAIVVADYQIKLTNINNAQNLAEICLDHFFRFYCFATVVFILHPTIRNITTVYYLFQFNRQVIADEASGKIKEPKE